MSADPLVSVICTARNASLTIEMTLQSIERQTFGSWEMIIVDDGSTDHTPAIVEPYERRDSRMRLIRTPGLGRARALNNALSHARAEFVANLDADDLSHPQRLSIQYQTMRNDPKITLLCTDILSVRLNEQPVWPDLDPSNLDSRG
jgi:teichuronic acid biosynthesis glycosyltransferase TuaG